MNNPTFTHVAVFVGDIDASISFYRRYARMLVVHERRETNGSRVAWLSDDSHSFVLVLVCPARMSLKMRLLRSVARLIGSASHMGVECASREEVIARCEQARREGILRQEVRDLPLPTGFYGMIMDPDGNSLEVSHGQTTRSVFETVSAEDAAGDVPPLAGER